VTPFVATLIGVTAAVFVVGFTRRHLPLQVVRLGVVLGLVAPVAATGYGAVELWRGDVGWRELTLFAVLFVGPGLGITIGYHRLLAHRSFETGRGVEGALLVLGAMSLPTTPTDFVAYHLEHHAHSDRDGDPHSPLEGFFHAHVGWFVASDRPPDRERYAARLRADPVVRFVDRTMMLWYALGFAVPLLAAGWQGLVWGGLIRMAVGNNATFAVNSICHSFGSRPFETRDRSRNNLVVALLSFGEGWHNNHHAFPSSAYHGHRWTQPDLSAAVIRMLARAGLVWNVKTPPEQAIKTT
jgi:stearoyl-CoA desaturase (delta-9 desaturase)